jgi:hypothetical protein
VAVTVSVEEFPCVTKVGLAVIATLGEAVGVFEDVLPLPQEADKAINVAHRNKADHEVRLLIILHSFHPSFKELVIELSGFASMHSGQERRFHSYCDAFSGTSVAHSERI